MTTDYESEFQNGKGRKGKHKYSAGKLKLKAARPWKLVGSEGEVVFAWHMSDGEHTEHRSSPATPHLQHPLPPRAQDGEVSVPIFCRSLHGCFTWEVGDSFLRAEYIPF